MTTRKLKDSNWASARKSIIMKYDKNGDGNFDKEEVEGIIDDYMGMIYNKQTLDDANKAQKKIIIFSAIMIVLLSISNLGTGIAAANISKDIRIIDGKMVEAGRNKSFNALMTERSVKMFDMYATRASMDRKLQVDADEDEDEEAIKSDAIGCISKETAEEVLETVAMTGHANLVLKNTKSMFLTSVISIQGSAMVKSVSGRLLSAGSDVDTGNKEFFFPHAEVKFVPNDAGCQPEGTDEAAGKPEEKSLKKFGGNYYGVYNVL